MKRIIETVSRGVARARRLLALAGLTAAVATSAQAQPFVAVQRNASGVLVVGGVTASLSLGTGAVFTNSGSIVGAGGLSLSGNITGATGSLSSLWVNGSQITGTVTGLTLSASAGLTAGVTASTSIPALTLTLSNNLLGFNATSSASFPTFTQLSASLSSYQPLAANLTGWAATSSASYLTAANITASYSTYPANSLSGTLFTVSVSNQTPFAVTSGSTLAFAAGTNTTLTLSGGALTINSTGGGSNAINLLITGSASPAANSASLSMASGTTVSTSGSGTLSLSAGLNTFAGGLSSSGVLRVTDATAATSSVAAALIVTGGIGAGGVFTPTVSTQTLSIRDASNSLGTIYYANTNATFIFGGNGGGSHATLVDYGGNLGLGILAPVFSTTANGAVNATATYASTTWGPTIQWKADLFDYNIGAGGSTQAAGADGVPRANRFYFNNGHTTSMTIESLSGAMSLWRGLAVTGSNSFLTVSVASTFTGTMSAASASFTSVTLSSLANGFVVANGAGLLSVSGLTAALTGWGSTSSASYLTAANVSASLSAYALLGTGNNFTAVNSFSNTTAATSSQAGAVTLSGGLAVRLDSYFGNNVVVGDALSANSFFSVGDITTNSLLTAGGAEIGITLSVGGGINLQGIKTPAAATGFLVQINTTSGVITSTTVSAGGSNAINLLITGSASPAANSASLSVPSGMVLTLSGSTPVTLSMGTGLNTFAGGLSSSGALNVTNATASTGTTSGAANIAGGLGVQGAMYASSVTVSEGGLTLFKAGLGAFTITNSGGTAQIEFNAGNNQFWFSSYGSNATLTNVAGGSGLGIYGPILKAGGGVSSATASYSSTTDGGSIRFASNSFSALILAGGSTQAAGGDGVVTANRFNIGANANTISATIESLSGAMSLWRGLAVTGSNSFLTVSVASTFTGTLSAASASFTTATFAAGITGSFSSFAALNTSTSYTLTTASPRLVLFTGSNGATTHTISVDATTQQIGAEWRIVNTGTASVTLKGNGGGTLGTAYTNSITLATLNSVTTTSGSYTVQRIPLLDSNGRLAPGGGTLLGPNYLDLNNGYISSGFTVSGSVQLGANNLTSSGTIAVNTLTASTVTLTNYLVVATLTASAITTTGSVNLTGGTLTISSLPTSGATDFVGMINPGSQIVELSVVDAASLLGLPSSRTVKQDIVAINGSEATATLSKVEVVRYKYTAASGQDATKPHIGFIAEDVANVFPEGGNTVGPKSKLVPSVSDRDLLALLFAVVQEQQREIEKLKAAAKK